MMGYSSDVNEKYYMANTFSRYVALCDRSGVPIHFPEILHFATKIQIMIKTDAIAQFRIPYSKDVKNPTICWILSVLTLR